MQDHGDQLPDDVETLKRWVMGRDEIIAKLMAEIARLKRWRFGRSSEQMSVALMQLQLALDELPPPAKPEPEALARADSATPEPQKTQTPARRMLRLTES